MNNEKLSRLSIERGKRDLERGSKTFSLVAKLLDREARKSAYQLYAWGRHCDDVVDGQVLGHGQHRRPGGLEAERARLAELRTKTESALAGTPFDDPIYGGLAEAVARHSIPSHRPLELLEGLGQDVEGVRYRSIDELQRYAELVAGSVAAMVGYVMGGRDPRMIAAFELLGTAVQFTNIARDVIDDSMSGRVYLPLDQLAEAGVPAGELALIRHRLGLAQIAGRILDRADRLYEEGLGRIGALPFRYRAVVLAGSLAYREIGREIRARGPRAWDDRVVVRAGRRISLLTRAVARAALGR